MRTLHRYGLVSIVSHGDTFTNFKYDEKKKTSKILGLGDNAKSAKTLVFLRGGASKAEFKRKDVQKALRTGALIYMDDDLAVTAVFFKDWVNPFPGSVIYLGSCRSGRTGDVPKLLLKKGAKAVLGFTNYVPSDWAKDRAEEFFDCMFTGKGLKNGEIPTAQTCFKPARDAGSNTKFVIFPAKPNARLVGHKDFMNGDFEQGLGAWSVEGDARVIPKLAGTTPRGGSKMVILSTGLGFTKGLGSISQSMCVGDVKPKTLSFKWRMYSAEFKKFCDKDIFQDTFRITVSSGNKSVIFPKPTQQGAEAGFHVKEFCDKVSPSDFTIPELKKGSTQNQDQDGTFMTDWQDTSFDFSELAIASDVTIKLEVVDRGDSTYDTAVLIDNVELKP